jgi:hypothetical protein
MAVITATKNETTNTYDFNVTFNFNFTVKADDLKDAWKKAYAAVKAVKSTKDFSLFGTIKKMKQTDEVLFLG